jgi:hypothetical protein
MMWKNNAVEQGHRSDAMKQQKEGRDADTPEGSIDPWTRGQWAEKVARQE